MNGICAASNVWAVGYDSNYGSVARWNGSSWKVDSLTDTTNLYGIWGTDTTHVWAVGWLLANSQGVVTRWNGTTWQSVGVNEAGGNPVNRLRAIWGNSASDLWAVGGGTGIGDVSRGNGNTWSTASPVGSAPLLGVSGVASNDVWAVSYPGAWHWKGGSWAGPTLPSGMGGIAAVWAASSNDVWMAGADASSTSGMVSHWNGSSWSNAMPISGAATLNGVWGGASNDVWVVGWTPDSNSGVVSHYNGSVWSAATTVSGTSTLNAVWSSGPKDIWVAGSCGSGACTVHGDGNAWAAPVLMPDLTAFNSLWGVAR